jgi:hypothetical protein
MSKCPRHCRDDLGALSGRTNDVEQFGVSDRRRIGSIEFERAERVSEHDEAVDPAEGCALELRMFLAEDPLDRNGASLRLAADTANPQAIVEPFAVMAGDMTRVALRFNHHDAARTQDYVVDIPESSRKSHIIDEEVVVR